MEKKILGLVLMILFVGLSASPGLALTVPGGSGGTWDAGTRTFTLTGDVSETIQIVESDLTLDGAGYTVTPTSGNGVTIIYKTEVIVTNLKVDGAPGTGIMVSDNSASCQVVGNTITNCPTGIYLYGGHDNIISGNTVFVNGTGIGFANATYNNTVTHNIILGNDYGIGFSDSANRITVYNNDFIANGVQAQAFSFTDNNVYYDNDEGGNYWDDWDILYDDDDGDGFLDEPRRNLPGSSDGDQLPLANMYPVKFFDDCRVDETITARGKDPNVRLDAFRSMLEDAQAEILLGEYGAPCPYLADAMDNCDGVKRDLITGPDVPALFIMIENLAIAWGCP